MMTKLRLQDQHPGLQGAVADPTVTHVYRPGPRLYYLPVLYEGRIPRRQSFPPGPRSGLGSYSFHYCPFSGNLLPGDLWDTRIDRIVKLGGSKDLEFLDDGRRMPKWAISEDWWIAEGIGPVHDEEHLHELKTAPPQWLYEKNLPYPGYEHLVSPGYKISQDEPDHYCNGLSTIFSREYYMFWYLPHTREYGPRIIDPNKRIDHQPIRILPVSYCPWCGTKLPKSKRPEWETKVRGAGFDPDNPEAEGFPEHLLRDKWWRTKKKKACSPVV